MDYRVVDSNVQYLEKDGLLYNRHYFQLLERMHSYWSLWIEIRALTEEVIELHELLDKLVFNDLVKTTSVSMIL